MINTTSIPTPRADPGYEVRGGANGCANGLENIK